MATTQHAPTASGSLNKGAVFAPGDTMTLTITYADADTKTGAVTFEVSDAEGGTSGKIPVPYSIKDPEQLTATDPDRAWTLASDNGAVAVYQSVA